MNKTELIAAVAEKTGLTKKDAERVVSATFETVAAELAKGEKVQVLASVTSRLRPVRLVPAVTPAPRRPSRFLLPSCPYSRLLRL